jgi:hypothetical protein
VSPLDLLALVARFLVDLAVLILLYDFFVQPFRFYGMDPLTRFVWAAARKMCAPFDTFSRKVIQLPDRDLAPLFTLFILVFCRGLVYALTAIGAGNAVLAIVVGVTLSFLELFTRMLFPGILFLIYLDIQLSSHQGTFVGNVFVMLIHDVAKRIIVMIRRLLPSYRPLHVFITVFVLLGLAQAALSVIALLPFIQSSVLMDFSPVLRPEMIRHFDTPGIIVPFVYLRLAETFLFGIFILILMHMLTGLSGLDPYDRFSILLGLAVSPWLMWSRRLFPWARVGMFDFSIAILLMIPYLILRVIEAAIFRGL